MERRKRQKPHCSMCGGTGHTKKKCRNSFPLQSKFIIYALVDPRTGRHRYIGKSSSGMLRPRQHADLAKTERTHKGYWIQSLLRVGARPRIIVLEQTTKELLNEREIWWINNYRSRNQRLLNIQLGGDNFDVSCVKEAGYRPPFMTSAERIAFDTHAATTRISNTTTKIALKKQRFQEALKELREARLAKRHARGQR